MTEIELIKLAEKAVEKLKEKNKRLFKFKINNIEEDIYVNKKGTE